MRDLVLLSLFKSSAVVEYCLDLQPSQIEENFVNLDYDEFLLKCREIILETLSNTSPEIACSLFKISPSLLSSILSSSFSSTIFPNFSWKRSFQSLSFSPELPKKRVHPNTSLLLSTYSPPKKPKYNLITHTQAFLSSTPHPIKKKCTFVREVEQSLILKMISEVNETSSLPKVADKFNIKRDSLKMWYNKYYEGRLTDEVHWQEEQISDTIYKAFKLIESDINAENDKLGFQRYRTHTINNSFS